MTGIIIPAWHRNPDMGPCPPAASAGTGGSQQSPPLGVPPNLVAWGGPAGVEHPEGGEGGPRALEGAARPGRHYTAVGRGASLAVPEGGPRRRTRGVRGPPGHKARFVLRSPPGAGTNGLAAAEVICQAEPGVRPGEGAAREGGAQGPAGCGWGGRWTSRGLCGRSSVYPSVQQERSFLSCPPLGANVRIKVGELQ